jgi:dienelactone hydrolase
MAQTPDGGDPEAARRELLGLLGDLPAVTGPVSARLLAVHEHEAYRLEHLVLDLNGLEPVPAYFTQPRGTPGPWPAVLFHHSHGGNFATGKEELIAGASYMARPPYAEVLARRGIAALCIDAWNFGERRGRTESELFKEMLWKGQVLWGMMVFDALRAMDYLCQRPDVDPGRVGTLGMSMGSTMAWWQAALDTRVRVCVDICCLTDFHTLIELRNLDGHGLYYYVPGLLKRFRTADINALIAPRPHLALAGEYDRLTPPAGLEAVDRRLREVYAALGAPEAWRLSRHKVGHLETAAMRAEALAFLERWL